MLDFLQFLFTQFYNIIMVLDDIVFFETLSLLKILIIVFVFDFIWKFLIIRGDK